MPDFGAPVAQNVNINPTQGIQTLSGILGLKQQQQALQTGQYAQQSAQANAIQQQQAAKEMRAGASLMSDPVGAGITDADGKPTDNAYSIIKRVMPITGDTQYKNLLDSATTSVNYKNAWAKMTTDQQNMISSRLAGVAADPATHTADLLDTLDKIKDEHSDEPQSKNIDKLVESARNALTKVNDKHGPDAAKQVALQLSRGGLGNQGITGTGGIAAPQAATLDTGPTIQAGTQAPALQGGGFTPTTSTIKAPGPTQTIPYITQAAAAQANAGARATGIAGSDIERANQISAGIKPAMAGIQTTQQIDDLADQIHSGKFAAWISKGAAAAGIASPTYARQLLEKDLGIMKTQLTSAAPSDSRAATILSGTPEATSDPQTIHGAMDYIRGSLRQNVAQGNNLNTYRTKHPDLSGFQKADDAFTGTGGPLVHEFNSLKTTAEKSAFYKRNFKSSKEAIEFRNNAQAAAHTIGLSNGDR